MDYPDTPICLATMALARDHSPAFLYNHLMRSFGFGRQAGRAQGAAFDEEMLFVGCLLHNLGLVDRFVAGERFEIDGADAAADFLSRQGYPDAKIAIVWDAIALHTTLGVPQRKGPEIALVQLSAGIDVGAAPRELIGTEAVNAILAEWPRLGFKVAFLEAMARIARQKPATGAVNLMGEVGRHQKGLPIPDFCQIVHNSHFTE